MGQQVVLADERLLLLHVGPTHLSSMTGVHDSFSSALRARYRIERELGRGGMGVVLLAHDVRHDRSVAIKTLRPDVAHSVNAGRFLREIRVTAGLQHPNILPLLDSGEADGVTYYVMPFVPGESLRQRITRERQLPIADSIRITLEIADALHYAHSLGFVHRDIKPENILLGGGHAILTDFGVTHLLKATNEKFTETGVAIGTAAYMSPEQAAGGGEIDQRTDVYALGCVLYEMLTGAPPFSGSFQAVVARKLTEPVPSVRNARDSVPVHVERAITKALAREPEDRFPTAGEFATALTGEAVVSAAPPGTTRRKRWIAAAAAAVAIAIATVFVVTRDRAGTGGSRGPSLRTAFTQLTDHPDIEWFPSMSPDGKWVAYSGKRVGNRDIFLQSVGGQSAINLTEDSQADDDQPAFSPDGQRIAFRSARDGGGIFVMGLTGEGVRRVTQRGFRPAWSPDGSRIAFATANVENLPGNFEDASELWVADLKDAVPRKLISVDAVTPTWSPTGNRIAFARRFGASGRGGIWTISPDDGEPVALTQGPWRDWSPAWSPDGRYVYFSSNRSGNMNLWRVAIDESNGNPIGEPEPITTPAPFLAHPSVSADGKRIAYASTRITINIHRLAFDPVSATVRGEPVAITTGTRQWSTPDPSPDGEWIAFYSLTQPEGDVYVSRIDGSGMRQLTSDAAMDRVPRWSPDGKSIAMFSDRAGHLSIWAINADGSGLRPISAFPSNYFVWSPDGKRMAMNSGLLVGRDTLVIVDPNRSASEQEVQHLAPSNIGRLLPNSWSTDGTRIVGQIGTVAGAAQGIGLYDFTTNKYEKLTDFGEWPVWLPDNRRLLFVAHRNTYYVVDTRTREVRKVWSVDRDVIGPPRLTRDGRAIYFSRRVTEGDIWLLSLGEEK